MYSRKQGYELAGKYKQSVETVLEERRCDDCGVIVGNVHHCGCTLEECPQCGEAMATCTCDEVKTAQNRNGV